jgi:hypothetical protein
VVWLYFTTRKHLGIYHTQKHNRIPSHTQTSHHPKSRMVNSNNYETNQEEIVEQVFKEDHVMVGFRNISK